MASTRDTTGARNRPIVLDFRNVKKPILVRADDRDRFVTTEAEAARACQFFDQIHQWQGEFQQFLAHVHDWAGARAETVIRAYVAPALHGLEVFILTRGDGYRFDFDDEISKLDLELVESFPRCPAHVMQLPDDSPEALQSFFSPDKALQVHG